MKKCLKGSNEGRGEEEVNLTKLLFSQKHSSFLSLMYIY